MIIILIIVAFLIFLTLMINFSMQYQKMPKPKKINAIPKKINYGSKHNAPKIKKQ